MENSEKTEPAPIPAPIPAPSANGPAPFLGKTYDMVDDHSTNNIVCWGPNNNTFVVWDPPEFARHLLPMYFKHNNFSSFVRQLNTYGFRKVDPDRWEFANEGFLRGQKDLLKSITRRKPVQGPNNQQQSQQPHGQSSSVGACVEVGNFGLKEEVERLKRDKNVLMQELVRRRHQQQNTDNQLQSTVQRLQGMEQRQQQMMSFLAKAVHSPGFLAQFVQQQNESNRRITERNKKRRLKPEGDGIISENLSDGHIVKYQPQMNEAAKAVLRQLIKSDAPHRLENFDNGSNAFLTSDGGPRMSAMTLQEVPPLNGPSFPGLNSGVLVQSPSPSISDIRSPSLDIDSEMSPSIAAGEQNLSSLSLPPIDPAIPELSPFLMVPESSADISDIRSPSLDIDSEMSPSIAAREQNLSSLSLPPIDPAIPELSPFLMVPESSADMANSTSSGLNEETPLTFDNIMDAEFWNNDLLDDEVAKLPEIGDPFWEQFLSSPQLPAENEDMDLTSAEASAKENEVKVLKNMDQITEQIGHLISDAKKKMASPS